MRKILKSGNNYGELLKNQIFLFKLWMEETFYFIIAMI